MPVRGSSPQQAYGGGKSSHTKLDDLPVLTWDSRGLATMRYATHTFLEGVNGQRQGKDSPFLVHAGRNRPDVTKREELVDERVEFGLW